MIEVEASVEVPFHDVDQMGVVWHGYYAKYLEIGRCVLLDKIGYNYPQMVESGYSWPIIDMHIRYPKPARFQQKLTVKTRLVEWENRLKIDYLIVDQQTGQRLTKAHTVQVAVDMESQEMCFESPACFVEKVQRELQA
ncbi:hypothetical protein TDB9533_04230 [Thalassocella blandensis]|nr:hypothetical protein TDB9533_04230 [Thalassocella blandensis]